MTDDITSRASGAAETLPACRFCRGTGQEVYHHVVYGPEVHTCPDCEGTGIDPAARQEEPK